MGASAGGVEALRSVVGALPAELPAAIVVVLHIPADAPSALAAILDRAGPLRAVTARHGDVLEAGTIFAAPADHHVLVADGHLHLSRGPRENGHRPALDPLFRSAAADFGPAAIGVVLSGNRDDGTAGIAALARAGAPVLVQDPEEALYVGMPSSVIRHVPGVRALPATKLGAMIGELLSELVPAHEAAHDPLTEAEARIADISVEPADTTPDLDEAEPSGLSCPDCDGVLFRLPGEPAPRFRCRVGHAWSPTSLSAQQDEAIEGVLWSALRALAEKAELQRRLAESAAGVGRQGAADTHLRRAARAKSDAEALRRLLAGGAIEDEDEDVSPIG
ncbi:chemotaxis protein CheB [Pseudonocardia sulfidoxydans]|uniref:chemotaxis protein CheB n=1 Tax=Pseudonocardia sulfidoxydans TaxID=54011 RepID=UPI001649D87C|nr:chemotaxis protein CheB [Pseudonocardia sulfidoxydans]